jgi:tetratricopeptide (TPR) repeat protein
VEVANLKMVVSQYPQSRDARRDLGISYYQQHKYPEAVEQFEALQAIDSDDLTAHYNLSILYYRLGMEEKAATQAALFAVKKLDPAAPANALDFLREHTELSTEMESVPWHLHTDPAEAVRAVPAQPSERPPVKR